MDGSLQHELTPLFDVVEVSVLVTPDDRAPEAVTPSQRPRPGSFLIPQDLGEALHALECGRIDSSNRRAELARAEKHKPEPAGGGIRHTNVKH